MSPDKLGTIKLKRSIVKLDAVLQITIPKKLSLNLLFSLSACMKLALSNILFDVS